MLCTLELLILDSTAYALQLDVCVTTPGLCGPKVQTLHGRQSTLPTEPLLQPEAVVSSEAERGGHTSVGVGLSIRSLRVEGASWLLHTPPLPALHPSASRLMGSHLSLTYLPVMPVAHPRTIKGLFVCKHLASSTGAIHHACGRREADGGEGGEPGTQATPPSRQGCLGAAGTG